ncbi:MAG: pimeloyl-ACP methyl ester carboxylesterase [Paracoccaceae bacterium]|jgi:pimeloyl-ACP methyl ester carboxylesterase
MKTETLDLNGQPFFIRRWGNPDLPPLLMLHGFPEYGGAWSDLAPLLSDHFHCIAPDQRGYGQSWAPEGVKNYSVGALVSDMAALIDHIGGPLTVFGHDWGAAVAYALTIMRPELVDRLIIANGVHPVPFQRELSKGGAQSKASQYINFLRQDGSEDRLAEDNFARIGAMLTRGDNTAWISPERLATYKTEWARGGRLKTMIHWYRASPIAVADPDTPLENPPIMPADKLGLKQPHLLIWGEDDIALLPESTEGLEELAPNLTRVTFPNANHWICHQIPQDVADAVLKWTQTT